eukprot:CAMPEP_0114545004 /NCGR_PEP_ID=MMETSP0114-20121206/3172_1 /TAXON_ID=31324 /ORGANISM="Goniomonas sp, Strain m" /LENGTH=174 /DNA_ID=CAMNT_0001729409 /DNA_START=24 /DNA_END=546 /DNA_ORIENTATION=+
MTSPPTIQVSGLGELCDMEAPTAWWLPSSTATSPPSTDVGGQRMDWSTESRSNFLSESSFSYPSTPEVELLKEAEEDWFKLQMNIEEKTINWTIFDTVGQRSRSRMKGLRSGLPEGTLTGKIINEYASEGHAQHYLDLLFGFVQDRNLESLALKACDGVGPSLGADIIQHFFAI